MVDPGETPPPTTTIVVMGVSGSGKTTVALELVRRLGWPFAEGDELHPIANVEKMRSGHPLDDEDRWPWLEALAAWIGDRERAGQSVVVTCSALKRCYRELLRRGHPSVWFAHVTAPALVIGERVVRREGHYMPPSLLHSQLATLEPLRPDEPGVLVAADRSPVVVVDHLLAALAAERPALRTTELNIVAERAADDR